MMAVTKKYAHTKQGSRNDERKIWAYFFEASVSSKVRKTAIIAMRRNPEISKLGNRYSNFLKNFPIVPATAKRRVGKNRTLNVEPRWTEKLIIRLLAH